MENSQAIRDNRHAISNLTTILWQFQATQNLSAAVQDNRHAICNLTTLVQENGEMQSTDHNLSQAIRNNEEGLHNLTTSTQENKQAIHNLTQAVQDFHPIHSCNETKSARPGSTSGNYTILDGNGTLREVYCHMEQICGSSGWMRVAHLNMTDPSEQCPSGFRLYNESGVRACGSLTLAIGCQVSVRFPTHGVPFSEVCGRITGYQYWSPDAFSTSADVDGVILTYGSHHNHIWSFAATNQESSTRFPCSHGSRNTNPFIGNDYFCESGNSSPPSVQRKLYSESLWDGQGCRSNETPCCIILPVYHGSTRGSVLLPPTSLS